MEKVPEPPLSRQSFDWSPYADATWRMLDWTNDQDIFAGYFDTYEQLLVHQRNWAQRNGRMLRRTKIAPERCMFAYYPRETPGPIPTAPGRPFLAHLRTSVERSREIDAILSEAGRDVRTLADEAYANDNPRREAAYAVAELLDPQEPTG